MNTPNMIDLTPRTTSFAVGARVAEVLFNELHDKPMDFGLPIYRSGDSVQDQNKAVLAGILPVLAANMATTDAWLSSNLVKLHVPDIMRDSVAISINRWLIRHGLVNNRASEYFRLVGGELRKVKQWDVTEKVIKLIEATPEETKWTVLDNPFEGEITRVKGKSRSSQNNELALIKQDETALKLNPLTLAICKHFDKQVRANEGDPDKAEARLREIKALKNEFLNRGERPLYMVHTQDFRGRMYARGGQISTQGGKACKVGITFADPKPVNEEELDIYLGRLKKCRGTNTEAALVGFNERVNPTLMETKALMADPFRAIIRLDGCSNGIQWMSAFMNDASGMKLTNLTGDGTHDLYSHLAKAYGFLQREVRPRKRVNGELVNLPAKWMDARDQAKGFVMPLSYGAAISSSANALGVTEDYIKKLVVITNGILPINRYLNHIVNNVEYSDADKFVWEMPDGFRVVHQEHSFDVIKSTNTRHMKVLSSKQLDHDAMARALAPHIIHSIDAYHARLIQLAADFPVVSIHDSFGCHSCNVPALREIIRETFKQVLREDVMNSIMRQLDFDEIGEPVNPDLITNPYMFQ